MLASFVDVFKAQLSPEKLNSTKRWKALVVVLDTTLVFVCI